MVHFSRYGIKALSSDEIENIFTFLTPKETSKVCATNTQFNVVCDRESLWRNKVKRCYGVKEEMRGRSWRDMAKIFFTRDMIDLGKKWVNGMTYLEILEDADKRGSESLVYIHYWKNEYLKKAFNNDSLAIDVFYSDIQYLAETLPDLLNRKITKEDMIKIFEILTRELNVISAAVAVRYYSYPDLPAVVELEAIRNLRPDLAEYTGAVRKMTDEYSVAIDDLFDYLPYLINYSSCDDDYLHNVIYPDIGGAF
uniref:F-box domain-containing protein n=1 Tax=Pithovirus LCPAC403 TaxID=2506596 RepID=A0A481ZAF0_9VIRU|nr:MAG: uncharacterized protein LCPAC403_00080 [Pithovirus LCPAC403]